MSDTITSPLAKRCEKVWGRTPTQEELSLLQRIRDSLELREDDTLWDILIALQAQKFYYDELPEKIKKTVTDSLAELEKSAEIETQKAQGKLAECVVEQAQKMADTSSLSFLLCNAAVILFCTVLTCSISMWAGYTLLAVASQFLRRCCCTFRLALCLLLCLSAWACFFSSALHPKRHQK